MSSISNSRPPSEAFVGGRPPTLSDILIDAAAPPYTRTAFMAYLSQNHCMETLEFTLDSQRYATFYAQLETQESVIREATYRVCALWERLMQVYITPGAPRELNLPAIVRDQLLQVVSRPTPPHPSQLDDAARIVFDLMNDSLLVPFFESVTHAHEHSPNEGRPRSKTELTRPRSKVFSRGSKSSSPEPGELTDDSDMNLHSASEPMTPPTTPPLSDWSFQNPHGGLHRAVAAHSMGWKKMGAKLGLHRKSSHRQNVMSASSAHDASMIPTLHDQHDLL